MSSWNRVVIAADLYQRQLIRLSQELEWKRAKENVLWNCW